MMALDKMEVFATSITKNAQAIETRRHEIIASVKSYKTNQ